MLINDHFQKKIVLWLVGCTENILLPSILQPSFTNLDKSQKIRYLNFKYFSPSPRKSIP